MIKLSNLYVKNIEKLAQECKIPLKKSAKKADKIKTILNAGIPEDKLKRLYEKYFNEQSTVKPRSTTTVNRLKLVEDQIKFIMTKIDEINVKLANLSSTDPSINTHDILDIKNIIKSKILPGKSITVDELLNIKRLNKFTRDSIYTAVIDLVDEEIFDVSKGNSKNQIQGYIGRLIRR